MSQLPNWVQQNPQKLIRRLEEEVRTIKVSFPNFEIMIDGNIMYAEGVFVTRNLNAYQLRLYYPATFPYNPPDAVVMDYDVKAYCLTHGMHQTHNRGEAYGGIILCVMKPDDQVGAGWHPSHLGLTILNIAAAWLHAHEIQIRSGNWVLPVAT